MKFIVIILIIAIIIMLSVDKTMDYFTTTLAPIQITAMNTLKYGLFTNLSIYKTKTLNDRLKTEVIGLQPLIASDITQLSGMSLKNIYESIIKKYNSQLPRYSLPVYTSVSSNMATNNITPALINLLTTTRYDRDSLIIKMQTIFNTSTDLTINLMNIQQLIRSLSYKIKILRTNPNISTELDSIYLKLYNYLGDKMIYDNSTLQEYIDYINILNNAPF